MLRRSRRRLLLAAEVEDRPLAGEPVGLHPSTPRRGLLEHLDHPAARVAGRVQRAAPNQRLQRPLVRDLRIDALGEVPDRRERPAVTPRRDDRPRRRVADVLDRVQPEADLPLDDREVVLRRVHVGRLDLDPQLVTRAHVERHAVLRVHHGRDQRGHVLARVVRPQPGRAVRDQRVAGGVRLVERVVLRRLHVLPELVRNGRCRPGLRAALEELLLERRHQVVDLLADRLAQVVRLGRRKARDLLGNLQVLLLVDAEWTSTLFATKLWMPSTVMS